MEALCEYPSGVKQKAGRMEKKWLCLLPVATVCALCPLVIFIYISIVTQEESAQNPPLWMTVLGAVCCGATVCALVVLCIRVKGTAESASKNSPSAYGTITEEQQGLSNAEPTGKASYKKENSEVDVVLDRSTAHCKLYVSPDGKSVRWVEEGVQNPPSDPSRFDTEPFVLGTMGLCWRSYWEVCVEGKEDWLLGVALDTADRKGQLQLSPSKGFWVIRQSNGRTLKAMNEQLDVVKDKPIPSTVGVYLDYKEQKVSFYNADDESLIYTFTNGPSYDNRVRPLFSPWNNDPDALKVLSITSL